MLRKVETLSFLACGIRLGLSDAAMALSSVLCPLCFILGMSQAMNNWREFGNPDGKQPMEVSIALPTFLLEKEHHNTILIIYLIAMVVIIPCEKRYHGDRYFPPLSVLKTPVHSTRG